MSLHEIYRPILSQLQAVESLLVKELSSKERFRDSLMADLTRHVSLMPGKRLRPALALLGANTAAHGRRKKNGSSSYVSQAVKLASSVEMIHTATLLHDDVIDGATLRRGLSTLNAKWGDTLSVLSGDYLYSKAFCLLSELNNQKVLQLMSDTARTVCEGEVAQIHHQYDYSLSRASYLKIIEWKTASLMGAAAESGALLTGATPTEAKRLGNFGLSFGIAFQILDDTQDLIGDQEVMGKSLGTDLALGQLTLPLLYLRDVAKPKLRRKLTQWFNGNGYRSTAQAQEQMQFLKEQAVDHGVQAYCNRVANQYLAKARSSVAPFPSSPHKQSLLGLTDYLLQIY